MKIKCPCGCGGGAIVQSIGFTCNCMDGCGLIIYDEKELEEMEVYVERGNV